MQLIVVRGAYRYALPLKVSAEYNSAEVQSMIEGYVSEPAVDMVYVDVGGRPVKVLHGEARLAAALATSYHNAVVHAQWQDGEGALCEDDFLGPFPPAPAPPPEARSPPTETAEEWTAVAPRVRAGRRGWLGLSSRRAERAVAATGCAEDEEWDAESRGDRVVFDDSFEMNADIVHGTQQRRDRFEYYDRLYA